MVRPRVRGCDGARPPLHVPGPLCGEAGHLAHRLHAGRIRRRQKWTRLSKPWGCAAGIL